MVDLLSLSVGRRWRALVVFRGVSLVGSLAQLFRDGHYYEHRRAAWVLFAVMLGWSVLTAWLYPRIRRRTWPLLLLDLLCTLAVAQAGHLIEGPAAIATETVRLTGWWPASVVVAWSLAGGWRWGAVAGAGVVAGGIPIGGPRTTVAATALMLLAALAVGHSDRRRVLAEDELHQSQQREAAAQERERLSRDIHDTVLQVLALIASRAAELGGEAAELGLLAGGQERVLREVIAAREGSPADGRLDLCRVLRQRAGRPRVVVTDPGSPVWLPAGQVRELRAAVESALDNVARHCGPQAAAWILVEEEPGVVRVSIQDDGPGMPPGRLMSAEAEGRLGITRSIRGRVHDLGGTVHIASTPGQGTRVELSLPRAQALR
jgi:signal transduction histidine kinase